MGVQGRHRAARGEPRQRGIVVGGGRRRRRAAEGAGARAERGGGGVIRGAGAAAAGARVGEVPQRPVPPPVPPALHRPPHLRAPRLLPPQARPHVRRRRQDPQRLRGPRRRHHCCPAMIASMSML